MKKLLLIILILLSISAGAQEHTIGVRGGLNFTNITGDGFYPGPETRKGMNAGLTYEWHLPGKIRLGMDVLYWGQGLISQYVANDDMENKGPYYDLKMNYDYLAVPLKIGYAIGEKIKIIPRIGIVTSYLLKAESITPPITYGGQTFDSKTSKINYIRKYDFAGLAELGVEFKLSDHLLLEPNLAYKHSFSLLYPEELWEFNVGDPRHYGFAASVAVRYRIK